MMLSLSHLSGDSRTARSLVYSPRRDSQRLASGFSGLSDTSTTEGKEVRQGKGVEDMVVTERCDRMKMVDNEDLVINLRRRKIWWWQLRRRVWRW